MNQARPQHYGRLIVNADDWGRDFETTERTLECVLKGAISSVSAMVFMEDSERAAAVAQDHGIDTGLHLNFTTPFTVAGCAAQLTNHQESVSRYLRRHRLAQVVFHPGLANSFEYLVSAQRDEFVRLFGKEPDRLDGHHHMHLCSNVVFGGLLRPGIKVRRNFSIQPGEKDVFNRFYRQTVDRIIARRHHLTDLFFSLPPLDPLSRVQKIFSLANEFTVEVETHPINSEEYRFLTGGEIFRLAGNRTIARSYALPSDGNARRSLHLSGHKG
jgi:predicted glycoside hydrolase/deacetylase ChbG (UPF0249 family)